jgi:hypothetical protein
VEALLFIKHYQNQTYNTNVNKVISLNVPIWPVACIDDKSKSRFAILFLQKWPLPNIQAQCQSSMKVIVQLHVLLPLGGHQQVRVFQVSLAVTAKGKEPHPITSHVT